MKHYLTKSINYFADRLFGPKSIDPIAPFHIVR